MELRPPDAGAPGAHPAAAGPAQRQQQRERPLMAALPVLGASRLEALFEDSARTVLETAALPSFLMNQRWFGGRARGSARVRLADGGPLQPPLTLFLAVADVEFADGGMER